MGYQLIGPSVIMKFYYLLLAAALSTATVDAGKKRKNKNPAPETPDCPEAPQCDGPGYCIPTHSPHPFRPEVTCPNWCTGPPCGDFQETCPPDYDSDGCLMPTTCAPLPDTCDGPQARQVSEWCPRSYDDSGCPAQPLCGPDEMMCTPPAPAFTDMAYARQIFCPPMSECYPATVFSEMDKPCPNICPLYECPEGMAGCPQDYNSEGCPMPLSCGTVNADGTMDCPMSYGSNGCALVYPPDCPEEASCVPLGADYRGCHLGFECYPPDSVCPPPQLPAPIYA